jgi:hypothetical protein
MHRREFLGFACVGAFHAIRMPRFNFSPIEDAPDAASAAEGGGATAGAAEAQASRAAKPFGSGHFGEWITDSHGLPAYHYTCDQVADPKAISPVHKEWRGPTDHTHQVGNDRVVAAVSNFGYVQVRQDEGSPKFLNDFSPVHGNFGAGIGFLTDGSQVLSTYYPGNADSFDRILGEGYLRKTVRAKPYEVDQVIFAPYGDDPVLLSAVTVTNHGAKSADLRWVEYWGCHNWQFSNRSWMLAETLHAEGCAALRRDFAGRFTHEFRAMPNQAGLLETQKFPGRSRDDTQSWEKMQEYLRDNPTGFFGGPVADYPPGVTMEDLNPPPTFLVSLDAPADGFTTDAGAFFGLGGIASPSGLSSPLNNDASSTGRSSAHLLERRVSLQPGQSRTMYFMYGYLPQGFEAAALIQKYSADPAGALQKSCAAWKTEGLRFNVPAEPWVEREISWHNYYLRSAMTYDSFFREPILSQGHVYQYIIGFQGAARDPLQHALPFVFSKPEVLKSVIRYTLKEIQPDGSIPYAIIGSGASMPALFRPSDQEMWLLWAASEYVMATRDKAFLDEKIPAYPHQNVSAGDASVGELLHRCYIHLVKDLGVGKHGLMRLSNGDWNDSVVVSRHSTDVSPEEIRQQSESVLNAAMASYVLGFYGSMLAYTGDAAAAEDARAKAEAQRAAVRDTWQGKWFKRAWLGEKLGWIGDDHLWLEPQPWAVIGGAATPGQSKTLLNSLNELVRDPSPIGAMLQSQGDPNMGAKVGTMENGGIWPSINGTLIWALALENGAQAWDEWKKNSLAMHAEKYPDVWYGIWSGPDTYNSVLSKFPGQTMFVESTGARREDLLDLGLDWTDFPVMNLHPHAWPLYSTAKLLGVEFRPDGVVFAPRLPLEEYEFSSPLLGFKKTKGGGYSGWYNPSVAGTWRVEIKLPRGQAAEAPNPGGQIGATPPASGGVVFTGPSKPGEPFRFGISPKGAKTSG